MGGGRHTALLTALVSGASAITELDRWHQYACQGDVDGLETALASPGQV